MDRAQAKKDAQELHDEVPKVMGTDKATFMRILAVESLEHLRVVFDEYEKMFMQTVEQMLEIEMKRNQLMNSQLLNSILAIGTALVPLFITFLILHLSINANISTDLKDLMC